MTDRPTRRERHEAVLALIDAALIENERVMSDLIPKRPEPPIVGVAA